jgi:hypothetical protein
MSFQENICENLSKQLNPENEGAYISYFPVIEDSNKYVKISNTMLLKKNINKNIVHSIKKEKRYMIGDLHMDTKEDGNNNFYKTKTKSVNIYKNFLEKVYFKYKIETDEFPLLNIYDCEYDCTEQIYSIGNISVIHTETIDKQNKKDAYVSIVCNYVNNKDTQKMLYDLKNILIAFNV